jgi:hypothetical protein
LGLGEEALTPRTVDDTPFPSANEDELVVKVLRQKAKRRTGGGRRGDERRGAPIAPAGDDGGGVDFVSVELASRVAAVESLTKKVFSALEDAEADRAAALVGRVDNLAARV